MQLTNYFWFSAGQAHEPLFMTIDPDLSKQRHGWWWGKQFI